ncbi:MAG: beta-ketoacyl-[acyl-carrier-protein] synthase family protein [bacterium]
MSKIPVVITGLGPVSAIGCGREEFWHSLRNGKHGFGPITRCDVSDSSSKIGAEVRDFQLERYVDNGHLIARRSPRAIQFALAASALSLKDANIDLNTCDRDRIGVNVGTSLANIGETFVSRDKWLTGRRIPSNMAFQLFNHSAACFLSSLFDLRGPMHTTSSGCNSGLDALGHALRLIQLGIVDAMLVVGTDCELVPEILAVLNASNALATRFNDEPGRASRPFDRDRNGNVLGEGAAALLLESEPHALARDAKIYACMAGYSVCAAGQHRRYSHDRPELDLGPCIRGLRGVMNEAGWQPEEVDLVNANGSSSVLYDRLEALALAEVFGEVFPDVRVHSIKSMLGQHGAGSSALQAVAACLSIDQGIVPPTINYENPDPACGPIRIATEAESSRPQNILTHSIGFGGFYYSCGAFTGLN